MRRNGIDAKNAPSSQNARSSIISSSREGGSRRFASMTIGCALRRCERGRLVAHRRGVKPGAGAVMIRPVGTGLVALLGATGYTGRLVAAELARGERPYRLRAPGSRRRAGERGAARGACRIGHRKDAL